MSNAVVVTVDAEGIATLSWQPKGDSNRLTPEALGQLEAAVDEVLASTSIRAAMITGAGDEFVGGWDAEWLLEAIAETGAGALTAQVERLNAVLRRIETSPKPFAAAIGGSALGLGLELAMACQRRFAARRADLQVGFTDLKLGLPPAAGGALRAARRLGGSAALPILLGGQPLTAAAALDAGLVDELAVPAELAESVRRWLVLAAARLSQQPAQAAVRAMLLEDADAPFEAALESAADRFVEVARGPVARHMVRTLGASVQRANNLASRPAGFARRRIAEVGVLGAGLMGSGIALVAARAGLPVVLLDVSREAAERGLGKLRQQEQAAVAAGRIDAAASSATLERIRPTQRYEDLAGVDLLVEAVFEDREVKAEATRRAGAVIPAHALFATNTSTLPISGLAEASDRPSQFIGLHFFSPVPRMPLVEVIRGRLTSDESLAGALDFVQAIGKTPIVVNDSRGFYTTRVVMAYQAESYDMLAQGVDPDLIEAAGVAAGMPVPPLALSDAVALDLVHQINLQSRKDLGEAYRQTPGYEMVGRLVEEFGRIGKKSGKGFYDWSPDGKKQLWPGLRDAAAQGRVHAATIADLRDRLLGAQALETARCLEEGVIVDPAEADVGAILGWGFAPWTGGPLSYIDGMGSARFVARCDELAASYAAPRLSAPAALRRIAAAGGTVYGSRWHRG
ncbi:3-hydroxyacyl-CoA dehydrogenase [Burkholderiales bacterium 8X]|nr:3-hydroxyacyl-CoA dehydrogenase [Burkholderiales bacterium 8X]